MLASVNVRTVVQLCLCSLLEKVVSARWGKVTHTRCAAADRDMYTSLLLARLQGPFRSPSLYQEASHTCWRLQRSGTSQETHTIYSKMKKKDSVSERNSMALVPYIPYFTDIIYLNQKNCKTFTTNVIIEYFAQIRGCASWAVCLDALVHSYYPSSSGPTLCLCASPVCLWSGQVWRHAWP